MGKEKRILCVSMVLIMITLCSCGNASTNEVAVDTLKKGSVDAGASIHDPQIVVGEDGYYYMFGTHMTAGTSRDLTHWNSLADGVNKWNKLFDNLFTEDHEAFSFVGKNEEGKYAVWAPNVIYNQAMGKYVMYFCTTSSFIKSNICFATADDVKGPYTYQDTILYSGFSKQNVDQTDFMQVMGEDVKISDYVKTGNFDNLSWPNCIDPAVFYDADGKIWMVYGSWSGGIFLLEIDEETGYPIHPNTEEETNTNRYYGKKLAGGGHNSIEGPYIQYDAKSGYYYLLVSYGSLTSNGGYQIREFRSKTVNGTYLDAKGQELSKVLDHSSYGVKMMGNYTLPTLDCTYMAPGGQSAFQDKDGKMYVVYHQRFDDGTENHQPRVHQMFSTANGWLVTTPFQTSGESLSEKGYNKNDVTGTFYILNHGTGISDKIHKTKETILHSGGTLEGGYSGTFELEDGSNDITIHIGDISYQGLIIEMDDEAGNPVLCFSAVGDNNETLFGVHYLKMHTDSMNENTTE